MALHKDFSDDPTMPWFPAIIQEVLAEVGPFHGIGPP
jgi:hypothetical protein